MKGRIFIILLVTILLFSPITADAFSVSVFFRSAVNLLDSTINRISDLVYYLSQQKRYLFDDFEDPNTYNDWPSADEVTGAVRDLNDQLGLDTSQTSAPDIVSRVNPGLPVPVSTTTIPETRKPVYSSPTPIGVVATTVPGLYFPPISVPDNIDKIKITSTETKISSDFDSSDILLYTNKERAKESLAPLSGNKILDKVATWRLEDLFDNQYFAHESPDGRSAPELAKKFGYSYLLIGENLALGVFSGDKGIVDAWMDSVGHRANILNGKYKELGVAKRLGEYKGNEVTIAVQIFGNPQSTCAKPTAETKAKIDEVTKELTLAQTQARKMLDSLNSIKDDPNLDRSYYNQKVQEYNYYAKSINEAVASLKALVNAYNSAVGNYNSCIKN